jgi:hypothetical protein
MVNGFPNIFMAYSPQAPLAMGNATMIIDVQVDLIISMINKQNLSGLRSIGPLYSAEIELKRKLEVMYQDSLLRLTSSWCNRGNTMNGKSECTAYLGGLDRYAQEFQETILSGHGFLVE